MNQVTGINELTYERVIEVLRYDAEAGVLERKLKNGEWRICGHRPICRGYGYVKIDGKTYYAHRLAWLLTYGEWPEHEIDHINRNKMDNRISNIREVSRAENQHNLGMYKDNSSGYPGVTWHKQANKYHAQIMLNGKRLHLGLYPTAEEAFTVYMLAKIKYHPTSPISQEYLRELTLAG